MIVLDVPIPPSVNRMRRVDWAHHNEHQSWKRDADKCLMLHRQNKQAPILGQFRITVEVNIDALRGDLDNILKVLCDYVVRCGFVSDDRKKYLRAIELRFATDPLPEGCRVTLTPFP